MNGPLRAETVSSSAAMTPYLDGWRGLAAGRPMRSPEWLLGWWESYAEPGDSLHLLLVKDDAANLVGLAPLYLQKIGHLPTLRVLGARDHCSHHTDWLSLPGNEYDVGQAVGGALIECQSDWQRLLLEAVDEDATALRSTMQFLGRQGCLVHRRRINSCWKISLPASLDEYLKKLSRSLRKRCRKLQQELMDSGRIRLCQVEKAEDLPQGFEILRNLHAARWGNSRQPQGVFSDKRFTTFHEKVARSLLANGQLRLAWLEYDGVPVAAEYQFYDDDTVYAYQAGLDVTAEAHPGKLSMITAIQFAIEHNCHEFDLLGGDEPYKENWRAMPTRCDDWRVWPRSFRGYLESACWHVYMVVARGLKTLLPDHRIRQLCKLCSSAKEVCGPRRSVR